MKRYKNAVQTIQNAVNTIIHITKTPTNYKPPPTHTHPHSSKQIKITKVQDNTQMK